MQQNLIANLLGLRAHTFHVYTFNHSVQNVVGMRLDGFSVQNGGSKKLVRLARVEFY